jgi:transposase
MDHYAGIDVSLELSSICVVDAQGKIVKVAKVASDREALVAFFVALGFAVRRIGLEAGPLSQWLHAGLKRAGFETVLQETRHVKAALSAMTVKTDRKDARGLAQPDADGSRRRMYSTIRQRKCPSRPGALLRRGRLREAYAHSSVFYHAMRKD